MSVEDRERAPSLREIIREYQRTATAHAKEWESKWEQFLREAAADRKQAAEDRGRWEEKWEQDRKRWELYWKQSEANAAGDRKLMVEAVLSLDRTQNAIVALMGRMIRLQQENNLLLRRLVSNGRFAGNGGGRTRRNRKSH